MQTAITELHEWIGNNHTHIEDATVFPSIISIQIDRNDYELLIQRLLAAERQQIERAYNRVWDDSGVVGTPTAEQYYSTTYNHAR